MRLERGDLLANRRLADAARAGDGGETAAIDHPNEQGDHVQTVQGAASPIPKREGIPFQMVRYKPF
jgi:hypothetical protein